MGSPLESEKIPRCFGMSAQVSPILPFPTCSHLQNARFHAVRFFQPVDARDVRMVQRSEELRFRLEPRQALLVFANSSGRTLIATSRSSLLSRAHRHQLLWNGNNASGLRFAGMTNIDNKRATILFFP